MRIQPKLRPQEDLRPGYGSRLECRNHSLALIDILVPHVLLDLLRLTDDVANRSYLSAC